MPESYPFLAVKDVDAAVAFYAEAFGTTEAMSESSPGMALRWRCS